MCIVNIVVGLTINTKMYQTLNIVPDLFDDAAKFIFDNDRALYRPFFEQVERFCIANNVLVGGKIGIDLLMGKPLTKDSFIWDLYTEDTFNTTKALATELSKVHSPHINPNYIGVRTEIRHREFTIVINTRALIRVYNMDQYRGLKLFDLMGPATRTSYFISEPIKCMPEEIQLIEIYHALYTPGKLSMWEEYTQAEAKIYSLIRDTLGEKALKTIEGGAPSVRVGDIADLIISKWAKGRDHVIIGDYAFDALGLTKNPSRLQIITDKPIDTVTAEIQSLLSREGSKLSPFGQTLTHVRYPLNIPTDFQITKHTIYIASEKDKTPIMDVFNSSAYEVIPYKIGDGDYAKVKIGNPWVLMRFKFIDLWVLKLILNLGKENSNYMKSRIRAVLESMEALHSIIEQSIKTSPLDLFQLTNYVGSYTSESVAKKKIIKERGEHFAMWFPTQPPQEPTAPSTQE